MIKEELQVLNEIERRKYIITSSKINSDLESSIIQLTTFLDNLSFLIFSNGNIISISTGVNKAIIGTDLISSSIYTLNSIKAVSKYGSIADSYTLLRKYRDDLFLYLYFLEVDNKFNILSNVTKKEEENIIKWNNNNLSDLDINEIFKYLGKNKKIFRMIKKYNLRDSWDELGKFLNNFVHSNGIDYVKKNYHENIDYKDEFKNLKSYLLEISLISITILILIKPTFIASSDYIDNLDMGIEPENGSQYFIAPFIIEFIDKHLEDRFVNLKMFLKDNIPMNI